MELYFENEEFNLLVKKGHISILKNSKKCTYKSIEFEVVVDSNNNSIALIS